MFVLRARDMVVRGGFVAAITNRTPFFLAGHASWRESLINDSRIGLFVDLGDGVLDALVETAAYVIENQSAADEPAVFLRLVKTRNKSKTLKRQVLALKEAEDEEQTFHLEPRELLRLPGSRFAYWAPKGILKAFEQKPSLRDLSVLVEVGLSSKDDFRFVRALWEVAAESLAFAEEHASHTRPWMPLAKGGEYSPYVGDIHLAVKWSYRGAEIAALVVARYPYLKGNAAWVLHPESQYGQPGLTYSKRTTSAFGPRLLPRGCVFNDQGISIFTEKLEDRFALLGLLTTRVVAFLLELSMASADAVASGSAARHYETSVIGSIPSPSKLENLPETVSEDTKAIAAELLAIAGCSEPSMFFVSPLVFGVKNTLEQSFLKRYHSFLRAHTRCIRRAFRIEQVVRSSFDFGEQDERAIDEEVGIHPGSLDQLSKLDVDQLKLLVDANEPKLIRLAAEKYGASRSISKKAFIANRKLELISLILNCHPETVIEHQIRHSLYSKSDLADFVRDLLSYFVGVAWGRWDIRRIEDLPVSLGITPESPATNYPPGHLHSKQMPQISGSEGAGHVAVPVGIDGILVDDSGTECDIVAAAYKEFRTVFDDSALWEEGAEILGYHDEGLRGWFAREFFQVHVKRYSRSRRKAPIYWQLATPSTSYSAWLYYNSLSSDTLFRLLNDHVSPKIQHEERKLTNLTQDGGTNPTAGRRGEINAQEMFVGELRTFRGEISRVAALWNPNLDDGVILNFAPLWRLVPQHKVWQKECKSAWEKICKGEFDWAHLAMHLWPERVVPKCARDHSLAIAHGLEKVLWQQDADGKWQPKGVTQADIEDLVRERTSTAVKDALKSLLNAPAPATGRSNRKRTPRTKRKRRYASYVPPKAVPIDAASNRQSVPSESHDLLAKVKQAIGAVNAGASKADVIGAAGITASEWNKAIKALLADRSVARTGQRRGARYHLRVGDA